MNHTFVSGLAGHRLRTFRSMGWKIPCSHSARRCTALPGSGTGCDSGCVVSVQLPCEGA
jgi:hypothetical protein